MKIVKIVTHHAKPERAAEVYAEEGVIAVGFNIGDPSGKSKSEIYELFEKKWGLSEAKAASATGSLLAFRDKIEIGDLVFAYATRNKVALVGEVIGDHTYNKRNRVGDPDGEIRYPNQRKVKWWDRPRNFDRSRLPDDISKKVALSGTIHIFEYNFDKLKKSLDRISAGTYFILQTGGGEYEDEPRKKYHFKEGIPGSVQLRNAENRGNFVYYENGEFYAKGEIGTITTHEEGDVSNYYAEIKSFREIGPIEFKGIRNRLSFDSVGQAGIRKISKDDYDTIIGANIIGTISEINQQYFNRMKQLLKEKKQIILYGPPGTGKTFIARQYAEFFFSRENFATQEIIDIDQVQNKEGLLDQLRRIKEKLGLDDFETKGHHKPNYVVGYLTPKEGFKVSRDNPSFELTIKVTNDGSIFLKAGFHRKIRNNEVVRGYYLKNLRKKIEELYNLLREESENVTFEYREKWRYSQKEEIKVEKLSKDELKDILERSDEITFFLAKKIEKLRLDVILRFFQRYLNVWYLATTQDLFKGPKGWDFVTFHPSFSYEQFVEGIVAKSTEEKGLEYIVESGVFKKICKRAGKNPDKDFLLIIDEINRGNIPKIFGELITLLEADKRQGSENEISTVLPYSGEKFSVPNNLYIIGTMNTADRSISLIDIALRRRFAFLEVLPSIEVMYKSYGFRSLNEAKESAKQGDLTALSVFALKELNRKLLEDENLESGKQIGHSYLMNKESEEEILRAWKHDILPLLEEYFYEDYSKIAEIFNNDQNLVNIREKRVENFSLKDLKGNFLDLVQTGE